MIEVALNSAEREPGGVLEGTVSWRYAEPPRDVEARLLWYTQGKGTVDTEVLDSVRFDAPGPHDRRTFRFSLPEAPYSFSGKLISLVWAVEAVATPGPEVARADFVMAPGGREILLHARP